MFLDAQAAGTPVSDPRLGPDVRPDAGRAALRAVLGFARCCPRSGCSPGCSLFHSSQMSLRCSFVIAASPFGRFLPRNPHVRRILRFSNIGRQRSRSESPPTRQWLKPVAGGVSPQNVQGGMAPRNEKNCGRGSGRCCLRPSRRPCASIQVWRRNPRPNWTLPAKVRLGVL
jgi:hypothetical protein